MGIYWKMLLFDIVKVGLGTFVFGFVALWHALLCRWPIAIHRQSVDFWGKGESQTIVAWLHLPVLQYMNLLGRSINCSIIKGNGLQTIMRQESFVRLFELICTFSSISNQVNKLANWHSASDVSAESFFSPSAALYWTKWMMMNEMMKLLNGKIARRE